MGVGSLEIDLGQIVVKCTRIDSELIFYQNIVICY